ncbi:hypothetical protein HYPSUDRAFT_898787 [Hypholoma sublateritium FD-334 SS-4]|uniref:WSC domain-containing protein n=1 Tax=Hypholoma sublateritium (strain FD-334 SS-4) TaxID=945553 RepID=A0A0D2NR69_HYPSF|nr:hypothetical protein HYPSUDRAFT_898787 [Hypholoma sublateritium FD-334 SS-4]
MPPPIFCSVRSRNIKGEVPEVPGSTHIAIHKDNINVTKTIRRTLSQRIGISTGATIENCISLCASKAYSISGLEIGKECWCGSSLLNVHATVPLNDCSQACKANYTELCGAANSLYLLEGYTGAVKVGFFHGRQEFTVLCATYLNC